MVEDLGRESNAIVRAVGTVGWVFARVDGGVAAGLDAVAAAGSMVDLGQSWFAPRALHARHGAECGALLPQ